MKLIIPTVFFFFLSFQSEAQEWQMFDDSSYYYSSIGDFKSAIPFSKRAVASAEIEFGRSSNIYYESLMYLGYNYRDIYNFEEALASFKEALDQSEISFGDTSFQYLNALFAIGISYQLMENYVDAEFYYLKCIEIVNIASETEYSDLTRGLLNMLSELYKAKGEFSKSQSYLSISLNHIKIKYGENSFEFAGELYRMGLLEEEMGDYKNAENHIFESIKIFEKNEHKDSISLAGCFISLAGIYVFQNNFKSAEFLFKRAEAIILKLIGKNSQEYSMYLNGMSLIKSKNGEYELAKLLIEEELDILMSLKPFKTRNYVNTLQNLAIVNQDLEDFNDAELNYLNAIKITEQSLGVNHQSYATILSNYAIFLNRLGRYEESMALGLKALELKKKLYGELNASYAISLMNIASYLKRTHEYSKADSFLNEASHIILHIYGEEHPEYGNLLGIKAGVLLRLNKVLEAESCYLKALEIRKKNMNKHEDVILSLNNLVNFYLTTNQFQKGEHFLLKAISLWDSIKGRNNLNSHSSTLLSNIGAFYYQTERYSDALPFIIRNFQFVKSELKNIFSFSNTKEKEIYLKKIYFENEINQSLPFKFNKAIPLALNSTILFKGLVLSSNINLLETIRKTNDSTLISLYGEYANLANLLSKEYSLPINTRRNDMEFHEQLYNQLDKEINIKLNKMDRNIIGTFEVLSTEIHGKIKESQAALEFSHFNFFDKEYTDSIFYCAYILKGGDTVPRQVFLFEQRQLDSVLSGLDYADCSRTECVQNRINDFHNWNSSGRKLYELIWSKLEPELKGMKTIYFSPSGKLHKINFAAIPNSDSSCISDSYHLVQLSSTREIAMPSYKPMYLTDTASIALFGGIKYDTDTTQLKNTVLQYHDKQNQPSLLLASRGYQTDSTQRGLQWNFLPGTQREVEQIQPLYRRARSYTMLQASEEAVKNLQGRQSPDVLHLATHGFFFKEGERKRDAEGKNIEFRFSQDPLIRSGLMMAGGNLRWKGETLPVGIEDGILTAKEVSAMNLMNTKLVVLSACETGLGDIKGSEGVFGLQRAFKMAGAKYILMSLWAVPDEATKDFMLHFYTDLKNGKDIESAFRATQTALRKQYSEPYYWAGFVLMR